MTLIDLYSRECLAAVACRSFSGADVASVLAVVGIDRGALPKKIRVDNGTEFTSKAPDHWAYWNHVELDFSRPGKPADNAFIEAFNGTAPARVPPQHWFTDLDEAQGVLGHWRDDYDNHRPHSASGAFAHGARSLVRCNRMLAGATPPTLLGRCRTNDHRPAAGARERHAIASDGLVDQARDRRTSERGRALHVNPARLVAGPLQQFLRIRQFLSTIEVQPNAVRARADRKNALVPALVR